MKKRSRRGGSLKGTGIAFLGGIGSAALANFAGQNISAVGKSYVISPAALLLTGAVLNGKGFTTLGASICGSAGTLGYLGFVMNRAARAASAAPALPAGETAGINRGIAPQLGERQPNLREVAGMRAATAV
jgi:hypothetical protein